MSTSTLIALVAGLVVGATLACAATWLILRAAHATDRAGLDAERADLRGRLEEQRERADEQRQRLEEQQDRLDDQRRHIEAISDRAVHDESAKAALAPLAATIARVERQVSVLERDRVEQFGELGERLGEVSASTRALRDQTASLAGSLNASSVRGLWGETQLRRVLEASGMLPRCDFEEQVRGVSRHEESVRPDVVVRLPGEKVLVIDAKAPLSGFLAAQRPGLNSAQRADQLSKHAAALRRHVDGQGLLVGIR